MSSNLFLSAHSKTRQNDLLTSTLVHRGASSTQPTAMILSRFASENNGIFHTGYAETSHQDRLYRVLAKTLASAEKHSR